MKIHIKKSGYKICLWILSCTIILFISCKKEETKQYFVGEVVEFEKFEKEFSLQSTIVSIDGPVTDYFRVIDSLIIFGDMSSSGKNFFWIYNLNKGEPLGQYCPKGNGPNENSVMLFSNQRYIKDGNIFFSVFDYQKSEYKIINLTESILNKQTVIEYVKSIDYQKFGIKVPLDYVYRLNNGDLLIKALCTPISDLSETYKPNTYYVLDSTANDMKREIEVFKEPVMRQYNLPSEKTHYNHNEMFFFSKDAFNLSRTKFAMTMQLIGQINIVDIESGKAFGVKLKGSHTLKDFETLTEPVPVTYTTIDCDDRFIFAKYESKSLHLKDLPYQSSEIHIFDWEGKPKYKVLLDKPILYFSWNFGSKKLYAVTSYEEVLCYDLSFIY